MTLPQLVVECWGRLQLWGPGNNPGPAAAAGLSRPTDAPEWEKQCHRLTLAGIAAPGSASACLQTFMLHLQHWPCWHSFPKSRDGLSAHRVPFTTPEPSSD